MTLLTSIHNDLLKNIKSAYNINPFLLEKFIDLGNNSQCYGKIENTHFTSSAFVIDKDRKHALLLNHSKYHKWLPFGGHWNDSGFSQETISQGAVREMLEEAFNNETIDFRLLNNANPLNLDIHQADNHTHYDLAFLIEIDKKTPFTLSKESKSIVWIELEQICLNRNNLFDHRLMQMAEDALKVSNKHSPLFSSNQNKAKN